MSRGRKTGGVSDAAAIPPGVPNATSFVLGPLSCGLVESVLKQRQSAFFFLVCSLSCECSNTCCDVQRLVLAVSAGAEVFDYGSGWKEVLSLIHI